MTTTVDQQVDPILKMLNEQGPWLFRYPDILWIFIGVSVIALLSSIAYLTHLKGQQGITVEVTKRYCKWGLGFMILSLGQIFVISLSVALLPDIIWLSLGVKHAYLLAPPGLELILDTARYLSRVMWVNLIVIVCLCATFFVFDSVYRYLKRQLEPAR